MKLLLLLLLALIETSCALDNDLYEDEEHVWAASQQLPQVPQSRSNVYQPHPPTVQDSYAVKVPNLGLVRGRIGYKTIKNRPINAYFGLRYARVGRGLARFQRAIPLGFGNQQINATNEPANCPQFPDLQTVIQAEARGVHVDDCLTLNIYTPPQARSLPVLVYIHGEMLFDGSAEEAQPDYFLEHDVILVSVNYRLAPFGFLTTLTKELPGNVALSDIHLALEWVHRYIQAFGGNPEEVTLFGQAGGATLAHALSLSGKAIGLFNKLILQSGTIANPYFIDLHPLDTVRSFAALARCPITVGYNESIAECLGRLSTSELLKIFKQHWEFNEPRGLNFTGGFKLVLDDQLGYLPTVLNANNTVPIIAGVTKDAGAFILSRFYDQVTALRSNNINDYIYLVLRHISQPIYYEQWRKWAIENIFTQQQIQYPTARSLAQGLLELTNYVLYRGPIMKIIRSIKREYPIYLYCFDYRGQYHRFADIRNPLPFGIDATLSDDNIYLFPYPEEVSHLKPEDKTIARTLTTMWVNFARFAIPNFNQGVWPNANTEYGPFLRITNSKDSPLEIDYHFGDGLALPNNV